MRGGFYERKESDFFGTFLERRDIERVKPTVFTDLFFHIPGVNMRNIGIGRDIIRFSRMTGLRVSHPDGCVPDLYIDGSIIGGAPGKPRLMSHNIVPPEAIEGVEVYRGATTPIQYKSACGVILIWTRRGG